MTWRFLIDANLPVALARAIEANGYQAVHAADLGLSGDEDMQLWHLAGQRGDMLVSKDADFADFAVLPNAKQLCCR